MHRQLSGKLHSVSSTTSRPWRINKDTMNGYVNPTYDRVLIKERCTVSKIAHCIGALSFFSFFTPRRSYFRYADRSYRGEYKGMIKHSN